MGQAYMNKLLIWLITIFSAFVFDTNGSAYEGRILLWTHPRDMATGIKTISILENQPYFRVISTSLLSCGGVSNIRLVLSITFVIKIYGVVCVQLTHFSSGDWKDIFIAHVIFIIKSEVSTFPIVIIFFRGRVSEMFVTSYSVTYCIYIPGKLGFCSHHCCAVYDEYK